jgi:hypothetical protein
MDSVKEVRATRKQFGRLMTLCRENGSSFLFEVHFQILAYTRQLYVQHRAVPIHEFRFQHVHN